MFAKHMTAPKVRGKSGSRTAHRGKGSTEQNLDRGERDEITGGDPMDRMVSQYGKQDPEAAPEASSPVEALDVA